MKTWAYLPFCVNQKPVCYSRLCAHATARSRIMRLYWRLIKWTAEINTKFQDLEWQQQLRLAHGRADPSSPWAQDTAPLVRMRNRYINVQPWDRSRIHLKVAEGKSDYINASPIALKCRCSSLVFIIQHILRSRLTGTVPAAEIETTYIVTQVSNEL